MQRDRLLHLRRSSQETELNRRDAGPTSQGHCEGRAGAHVSLYFPIARRAELNSSRVTFGYFPIEINGASPRGDGQRHVR